MRKFTIKILLAVKANKFTSATFSQKITETNFQNTSNNKGNQNVNEQREEAKKGPKVKRRSENSCTLSDYIQKDREHERQDGLPPVC